MLVIVRPSAVAVRWAVMVLAPIVTVPLTLTPGTSSSSVSVSWSPLADAVTLPYCSLPARVIVVPALHGGLLGDPTVLPMVAQFLSGRPVNDPGGAQLRSDAELITSAATAWRMPVTTSACPS